jgi:hypothetical protein
MRAQEMVEHLAWAFRLSTGREQAGCTVPPADRERFKQGLYSAIELELCLDGPRLSQQVCTHPLFGPIGHDDWSRTHDKHRYHHLLQSGLVE